jgi:hypothetical protein
MGEVIGDFCFGPCTSLSQVVFEAGCQTYLLVTTLLCKQFQFWWLLKQSKRGIWTASFDFAELIPPTLPLDFIGISSISVLA